MARQPIIVGDRAFATKAAAKKHYRLVLNVDPAGRFLDETEFRDVMDLLALHPRYTEKIGVGVQAVSITVNEYGTRSFILHRDDGSLEDFSYIKCVDGDHKPFVEFSRACRRSVESRLHDWKAAQMDGRTTRCAVSGEVVTFSEAHVDHKPPLTFSVIVKAFAVANNIDLLRVRYNRAGVVGVAFFDPSLSSQFDAFHARMAVLRIVRDTENLRASYGARVTPTEKDGTL